MISANHTHQLKVNSDNKYNSLVNKIKLIIVKEPGKTPEIQA